MAWAHLVERQVPEADCDLAVLGQAPAGGGVVHLANKHVENLQAQQVVGRGGALHRNSREEIGIGSWTGS